MLQRLIALALTGYAGLLLQAKPAAPSIDVPAGTALLLQATGEGAQVYSCTGNRWMLKAPDAKLLDQKGQVIGSHFAGPTWRLEDGSEIKGTAIAHQDSPDASSVPWLLVQAVPKTGSGKFSNVLYIRRTDTHGGSAGTEPCERGEKRVPYTAKYSFYVAG